MSGVALNLVNFDLFNKKLFLYGLKFVFVSDICDIFYCIQVLFIVLMANVLTAW